MGFFSSLATLTGYGLRGDSTLDVPQRLAEAQSALDALNLEASRRAAPADVLVEAVATVTSSSSTGVTVDDGILVALGLLVLMPTGTPVPVSTVARVPAVRIPDVQPGRTIPVRVAPHDPTAVVIDWRRIA